ncbi:MAG: Uma2 family endonuclease [Chloroflexi bacterium]|nr:Uma2 family endonuclease [Chloroflexota bacterium]
MVERRVSPEDLERMLDQDELDYQYELVDGEIIYLGLPSLYHNAVVLAILRLLFPFADAIGGRLFGEAAGFQTGPEGRNLRAPDVSLVTASRIAIVKGDGRWGLEAPDLAVRSSHRISTWAPTRARRCRNTWPPAPA